jgi:H+/Cl- antiporter ClcA
MKFHSTISKLDFALQTLTIGLFFVSFLAFDEYFLTCVFSIALAQAGSIIYHSLILKKSFERKRKLHYNLTTIALIVVLLIYFLLFLEIEMNIVLIFALVIIANISIMLTISYYLITLFEMLDQKKEAY